MIGIYHIDFYLPIALHCATMFQKNPIKIITYISDTVPVSTKESPGIRAITECRSTLNLYGDMKSTLLIYHAEKYSQNSSIIWSVWLIIYFSGLGIN